MQYRFAPKVDWRHIYDFGLRLGLGTVGLRQNPLSSLQVSLKAQREPW